MKDADKPFETKIYPPFGSSHRDGHSFAYRGSAIWFDDVFRFLERHCARGSEDAEGSIPGHLISSTDEKAPPSDLPPRLVE